MIVETDHEKERRIAGELNHLWRTQMAWNKGKTDKVMSELQLLQSTGASLATMPADPPPLSRRAASVVSEMELLESDLAQARLYGQEQAGKREVAENTIVELKREYEQWRSDHAAELRHVLNERDRALDELGEVKTRLRVIQEQIDRVFEPQQLPAPSMTDIDVMVQKAVDDTGEHHDHSGLQEAGS